MEEQFLPQEVVNTIVSYIPPVTASLLDKQTYCLVEDVRKTITSPSLDSVWGYMVTGVGVPYWHEVLGYIRPGHPVEHTTIGISGHRPAIHIFISRMYEDHRFPRDNSTVHIDLEDNAVIGKPDIPNMTIGYLASAVLILKKSEDSVLFRHALREFILKELESHYELTKRLLQELYVWLSINLMTVSSVPGSMEKIALDIAEMKEHDIPAATERLYKELQEKLGDTILRLPGNLCRTSD